MSYEWDPTKDVSNQEKHGFSLALIEEFQWDYAILDEIQWVDGEEREKWIGPIAKGLFVVVVTVRGEVTRVISLRGAKNIEKNRWRNEV